jgi:hypothetical protein
MSRAEMHSPEPPCARAGGSDFCLNPADTAHAIEVWGATEELIAVTRRNFVPMIVLVIDTSGSMSQMDPGSRRTRFQEVTAVVSDIAKFQVMMGGRVTVYFLNEIEHPVHIQTLAEHGALYRRMMRTVPGGTTPLVACVRAVKKDMACVLKFRLVVLTDGEPDEGPEALVASTAGMSVTFYGATHEECVIEYYEALANGEDVCTIDDYESEKAQVHRVNPTVQYSAYLHIARTVGAVDYTLSHLDSVAYEGAALAAVENTTGRNAHSSAIKILFGMLCLVMVAIVVPNLPELLHDAGRTVVECIDSIYTV